MPLRFKIMFFLIAPAELWIRIVAFLCGITYENNSRIDIRD